MKKKTAILMVALCCMIVTACTSGDVQSIADAGADAAEEIVNKAKEQKTVNNVELNSEEEMQEYALSYLKDKYDREFVIDKTYYKYKQKSNGNDSPMILNARVHPEDDDHLVAAFYLEDTGMIQEDFAVIQHQYEVEDILFPQFEEQGLEGRIIIDSSEMKEVPEDITAKQIIHDENVSIQVYQLVDRDHDRTEDFPLVRKWLDYLYTCDFQWVFGLAAEDDPDYFLLQIGCTDKGYHTGDEWSDKELLEDAEFTEISTKKRKKNYDKSGE
ncbi:MAG: hypothetical protein K5739_07850 [Lachnospiraceae bacterium]|nr:hypothetical protein [Lachnospiraceae bacterium]